MAGGFPLRKWISNHPDALKLIPKEYHATTSNLTIKDDTIKALGLSWSPTLDCLSFKMEASSITRITKRSVLSTIAQFFDPLLTPIFIRFKIFMQELWAIKLNWDDELGPAQVSTWQQLVSTLDQLNKIQIPRWIGTQSGPNLEIHGFCDASQLAMAAAVYIKTNENGILKNILLDSKSKVAPLKRMTIPRLELSSAVMLVKLMKHCHQLLNIIDSPCYLWTDSSIVYTWLSSHSSKWKEFVHNRVCFIQENLPHAQWKHVAGKENPADCATRGVTASELHAHNIWWSGPAWLLNDSTTWPTSPSSRVHDELFHEERQSNNANNLLSLHVSSTTSTPSIKNEDLISRYSTLEKLVKRTALAIKVVKRLKRQPTSLFDTPLTSDECDEALKKLIKHVQHMYFNKEIKLLMNKQLIPRSNVLLKSTPFLDSSKLLRVGGRLANADLPLATKHPFILPESGPFTSLVIQDAHHRTLHGSIKDTFSYIRNTYWILGGRNPIRLLLYKCVICIRHRQIRTNQLMGQLPSSRVNQHRPFLHSGVDYAGPFLIKHRKGKNTGLQKSWVSVFVCYSTSAIHLELVTDYSTEAFLAAYRRFTSRRGICSTLNSDCGTNFQGADRELKKMFSQDSIQLAKFASLIAMDGTRWSFNPPSAPHFGGKFEAAVKSMKYHLKRVVGDTKLTSEEFSTILIQIEAILNSRPLTPFTDDPDDLNVLTPAHFLIGQPLTLIPEPSLEHLNITRLSRWQRLSQMTQSFWKKWLKEYLQRHQTTYKWDQPCTPLKIGSIVLIMDERYPPAKWPLGRVVECHPGADGHVRVVTVKTSTTKFKRPIVKLCPLPVEESSNFSLPGSTKAGGNV